MRLSSPFSCEEKKEYPMAGYTLAHNTLAIAVRCIWSACFLFSLSTLFLRSPFACLFIVVSPFPPHSLRSLCHDRPAIMSRFTTDVHSLTKPDHNKTDTTSKTSPRSSRGTTRHICLKATSDTALYEKPNGCIKNTGRYEVVERRFFFS